MEPAGTGMGRVPGTSALVFIPAEDDDTMTEKYDSPPASPETQTPGENREDVVDEEVLAISDSDTELESDIDDNDENCMSITKEKLKQGKFGVVTFSIPTKTRNQ